MSFDTKSFSRTILGACVRVAKTSGFRQWLPPDKTEQPWNNPPPEQHIVGVAVQVLLQMGFRVMPEVIAREVWRAAMVKRAYRSKKGHIGRFDLVAWNTNGLPVAVLEVKSCYGSPINDLRNLAALAAAKVNCRSFLCLYAPEHGQLSARERLDQRLRGLARRVRLGVPEYRGTKHARCLNRGIETEQLGFAAVMVEVLGPRKR